MKFRHAFALLFMSTIYRGGQKGLDRLDTYGGMWNSWENFLAGAFIILFSVALCALAWRLLVGRDEW